MLSLSNLENMRHFTEIITTNTAEGISWSNDLFPRPQSKPVYKKDTAFKILDWKKSPLISQYSKAMTTANVLIICTMEQNKDNCKMKSLNYY